MRPVAEGQSTAAKTRKLIELTQELSDILGNQVQRDVAALDEKLADYIFFPLSHLFRNQQSQPMRLLELAIKSLTILIIHGWKSKISPELVQQLLILLTFIIGGVPGQDDPRDVPEETALEAFRALTALLTTAGTAGAATAAALVESKAVPAFGHGITVILEGISDGKTPAVQLEALRSICAAYKTVKDHEALASFLPGTVSHLTKTLAAPKEKIRVLVAATHTLKLVLVRVLGDIHTRHIAAAAKAKGEKEPNSNGGKILSPAWLNATSAQVKIALSTVLKLRTHQSDDVKLAIERLCVVLLDECHSSLENCASILIESAMILAPVESEPSLTETSLQDLAGIYPELGETMKVTVYNWVTSLPRLMQSGDESIKQQAIRNLLKGLELAANQQIITSTLEDSLSSALRDSVGLLLSQGKGIQTMNEVQLDNRLIYSTDLAVAGPALREYEPILMNQESQTATRTELLQLVTKLGSSSLQTRLAAEMLDYMRDSNSVTQVSSYWLSFEFMKAVFARSGDIDNFLDFSSLNISNQEEPESVFSDLYSHSVAILDSHMDLSDVDWRMEALAMEVTAYAASRSGTAFRPELIDVLYPIATFMGSPNSQLRGHAIVTLNSIALSCGYSNVSELIIDNVDYMVNSVALRLNTLDISPASTKVLTMMVRLSGPRLIPYLDDVVASIFGALDNYHGYPIFVESLFSVLKEMVEQGVKSDRLLIEGSKKQAPDHRKKRQEAITMDDIIETLQKRSERESEHRKEAEEEAVAKGHPKEPWKKEKDENMEEEESHTNTEVKKPPKTPTYALLEKVANLTQHHLTSPTPRLRKSLLDLLSTASPALAADEDSFLPLVNAIWPVVIDRLYDSEPYISIAACETLGILCSAAGDFLRTRIKTEWWDRLGKWCKKKKEEATTAQAKGTSVRNSSTTGKGSSSSVGEILLPIRLGNNLGGVAASDVISKSVQTSSLGRFAQAVQIWEAVTRLLTSIVSYVEIEPELFDAILELVEDSLSRDENLREALDIVNADAVWLAMYNRGEVEWMETPQMEGIVFTPMERLA
jgi:TELO2-interacting protein 1